MSRQQYEGNRADFEYDMGLFPLGMMGAMAAWLEEDREDALHGFLEAFSLPLSEWTRLDQRKPFYRLLTATHPIWSVRLPLAIQGRIQASSPLCCPLVVVGSCGGGVQ